MKNSEFTLALEEVFGSVFGNSLAQYLVLSPWGLIAIAALAQGVDPREVWDRLCDEMQVSESQRWVYRMDPKQRRRVKR